MSFDEKAERAACANAMLARGIDEWELNLWDTGGGKNDSLDGFLEGWLARAKWQPSAQLPAEAMLGYRASPLLHNSYIEPTDNPRPAGTESTK